MPEQTTHRRPDPIVYDRARAESIVNELIKWIGDVERRAGTHLVIDDVVDIIKGRGRWS